MSVYVSTKIVITASVDADGNQVNYARPNSALSEVSETFDVENSGEIELAASETDYAVPLAKIVGGRLLYLETTGDITVKLDGEVAGHVVKAGSGTKAKLLLRSEFTAAPVLTNNSSTAAAAVSFFVAGTKA